MMCIRAKEVVFLFQDFLYSYGPLKYLGASNVASGLLREALGPRRDFSHACNATFLHKTLFAPGTFSPNQGSPFQIPVPAK